MTDTGITDAGRTGGDDPDGLRDRPGQHPQRGSARSVFDIHNPVFLISALVIVAFVIITLALQDQADAIFVGVRDWLTANLAWFFLLAGDVFVILCLALIVSPWGSCGSAAGRRRRTMAMPAGSPCCSPPAWASG